MIQHLVTWLVETVGTLGYPGIVLLMGLESSFFPFPSEVVLPPAGFLAAKGDMNGFGVLAAGIAGSIGGALLNYFLAVRLGRPLLHRYARYVLIKEKSLDRAESFFRRHGEISTFVGRLVPVIRQLISLPAGLARMEMGKFILYTTAGAGIWCTILTYIGWYLGRNAELLRDGDIHRYTTVATMILLPLIGISLGVYIFLQRRNRLETGSDTTRTGTDENW